MLDEKNFIFTNFVFIFQVQLASTYKLTEDLEFQDYLVILLAIC